MTCCGCWRDICASVSLSPVVSISPTVIQYPDSISDLLSSGTCLHGICQSIRSNLTIRFVLSCVTFIHDVCTVVIKLISRLHQSLHNTFVICCSANAFVAYAIHDVLYCHVVIVSSTQITLSSFVVRYIPPWHTSSMFYLYLHGITVTDYSNDSMCDLLRDLD